MRYYVADGDKKKKVYDDKLVVVYPMGADGKADLTNGLAANGAKISWDVKKNVVASYTPAEGDGALTTIYLMPPTLLPQHKTLMWLLTSVALSTSHPSPIML